MNKAELIAFIETHKCGMVADRKSPQEAMDYAMSICPPEHKHTMTIGIYVVLNTYLNMFQSLVNELDNTVQETKVSS